jgi:hypothetical protein
MASSSVRKPTNIGKFNSTVDQLFEICLKYTDAEFANKIQYFQYKLELGRKSNPKMIVEKIMESMTPYISHIMTRDENFFISFDINKIHTDNQESLGILDGLKQVWTTVSDDKVKEKVWKLLQLCLMYGVMVTKDATQLSIINGYRKTPLVV